MDSNRLKYLIVREGCETITPEESAELHTYAANNALLYYYLHRLQDPDFFGVDLVEIESPGIPGMENVDWLLIKRRGDLPAIERLKNVLRKMMAMPPCRPS